MAIPMHDAVVSIDNASGVLTAITAQGNEVVINGEKNVAGFFTFDSEWEKQSEGGKRWSADLGFIVTPDTGQAHELLRAWFTGTGGARTFRCDSPDSNTGSLRYSGEVVLKTLNPIHAATAGSGDPVVSKSNLAGDGALSISVIA